MSQSSMKGVAAPPCRAGVGLRPRHHQHVLDERPLISWLEVHAENLMAGGMLAEDLASDVFVKLVNAFRGHNAPRTSLRGWLFQSM